uniref:small monomeric GTPase n=1 Tax=Amphilophus citrinellus TaxID=61819 RepID=A0A3Q0QYI8_AMPCI
MDVFFLLESSERSGSCQEEASTTVHLKKIILVMFGKMKMCNPAECNLVLLGVMGSGKSALTVKFLTKRFITEYDPNLEDIYSSEEVVDQQPVMLKVMDTWNVWLFINLRLCKTCTLISPLRQVSQSDGEALASRFGCSFFEVSACQDFHAVQHVFYEAVRRARRGGACGCLVPAVYASEDKALLGVPSFTTPCYKELPVPATAKLITVKTSRAQSKRRAATLTLLKGFKIF